VPADIDAALSCGGRQTGPSIRKNGAILPEKKCKFQEPAGRDRVIGLLQHRSRRSHNRKRENRAMWISLFTFAAGAAVCLTVAAVMMQSGQRTLRG
jgi:hypothetical protein